MQTDEADFEFTPGILDTPSLMTPNIVLNAQPAKLTFNPIQTNIPINNNNNNNNSENSSISNPSSIATTASSETSLSVSLADVKVSIIEDELKQSLTEPRKPTPSPFQKMSSTSVFVLDKPPPVIGDDGTAIEIPSTADVVKELEALTNTSLQFPMKPSINEHNEREATTISNGDNIRYGSPPTSNMNAIVSPKKKLLFRSQSHTEPTSPIQNNNNHNLSQSQKNNNDNSILNTQNGLDEENSTDDSSNNSFVRVADIPIIAHPSDAIINNNQQFKPMIDNGNEPQLNRQLKTEQNGIAQSIIKQPQQPVIINNNNNKRTYQVANIGSNITSITKANTIIIPQPSLNEVTSTEPLSSVKRQKTAPIPINTTGTIFRPTVPSLSATATATNSLTTTTLNDSNAGPDDPRKKQIRDSNREAARRCRERRRQYIEQLEGNLEQYKAQIKQLTDKLARVERENTQLRAILSETKILHPTSRLSANESHVDYANVVAATGMDLNSESNHQTDGGTIQRSYINRNNL